MRRLSGILRARQVACSFSDMSITCTSSIRSLVRRSARLAAGEQRPRLLNPFNMRGRYFASLQACEGLIPGFETCVFPLDQRTIRKFLASSDDRSGDCERYLEIHNKHIQSNEFVDLLDGVERSSVPREFRMQRARVDQIQDEAER